MHAGATGYLTPKDSRVRDVTGTDSLVPNPRRHHHSARRVADRRLPCLTLLPLTPSPTLTITYILHFNLHYMSRSTPSLAWNSPNLCGCLCSRSILAMEGPGINPKAHADTTNSNNLMQGPWPLKSNDHCRAKALPHQPGWVHDLVIMAIKGGSPFI